MRSPLDTSTLILAAVAVMLAILAYLKDPGLPMLGVKNGVSMLAFVIPRMVVAIILAGLMGHSASGPEWAKWGPTLKAFIAGLEQ